MGVELSRLFHLFACKSNCGLYIMKQCYFFVRFKISIYIPRSGFRIVEPNGENKNLQKDLYTLVSTPSMSCVIPRVEIRICILKLVFINDRLKLLSVT